MSWFARISKRRAELETELDAELAHHLAMKQRQLEEQGIAPEEARLAARRSLGNVSVLKDATREQWSFRALESLWADLAYSVRLLRKSRAFTLVAILTLAIGIGANAAIFSLLNGLFWKPLPVRNPEQLVRLTVTHLPPDYKQWENGREVKVDERRQMTYPMFEALQKRQQVFSGMFGLVGGGDMQVAVGGVPHRARVTAVGGSMFSVLGLQPEAGRLLNADDDAAGASPVAVISDQLWTRVFARSPGAIGAAISIESVPAIIAGVAPPAFQTLNAGGETDVWVTMAGIGAIYSQVDWRNNRGFWSIQPMARLRPGVTLEQARQHLAGIAPAVLADAMDPKLSARDANFFASMKFEPHLAPSGLPWVGEAYAPALWILQAAVGAVLLIAVTNLTNLFLARAAARRHEIALRLSLGAPISRIRRQLMLESVLIAAVGAGLGWISAQWLVSGFETLASTSSAVIRVATGVDWRIFAFLAAVLAIVVLVAGLIPAFSASRVSPQDALKKKSGSVVSLRFRSGLIVLQTALSLALLGGSGLMLASLRGLVEQNTGFQAENSAWVQPDLFNAGIDRERMPRAYLSLLSRIREQPNIVAAAWTAVIPLRGAFKNQAVEIAGRSDLSADQRTVFLHEVSDGYFAATGIPLIAGDDLPPPGSNRTEACVISENAARRFFGSPPEAIGQRIRQGQASLEVIGVAGDAKYLNIRETPPLTMYVPYLHAGTPKPGMSLAIRYRGPFDAAFSSLQYLFQKEAGRLPYTWIYTVRGNINQALNPERLVTWLLAGFAGFAILISVIGLAGLLSYSVEQRRKDFGIRMALGATPRRIKREIQLQGLALTAAGLLFGFALSYALRRSLDGYLFGVASSDLRIWTIGIAALLIAAIAATAIPASRAARVDPVSMLRDE